MARDGTTRGGVRIGAGRKRKALSEKILDGQISPLYADVKFDDLFEPPPPKDYLTAEQKGGSELCSGQIYNETYQWLKSVGCEKFVTKQMVENYAMAMARHIQCEELLSRYGLLAKHPTTNEPTTSPFVKMSLDYLKQANQNWYLIMQIVKENSTNTNIGSAEDTMEKLLRRVK